MKTRPDTNADSPLTIDHAQINFVNYTQYKFGWNVAQSSSSLCLIFIFTAIMPRILLPLLGIRRAIQYVCCASAVPQRRARLRRHSLCWASNPHVPIPFTLILTQTTGSAPFSSPAASHSSA